MGETGSGGTRRRAGAKRGDCWTGVAAHGQYRASSGGGGRQVKGGFWGPSTRHACAAFYLRCGQDGEEKRVEIQQAVLGRDCGGGRAAGARGLARYLTPYGGAYLNSHLHCAPRGGGTAPIQQEEGNVTARLGRRVTRVWGWVESWGLGVVA
jgi:hypothetical protein